uniref:Uncharacterized protein n=1 Tax=Physcomitrium patens TaxID=3218 RepID=A0A2K1JXB7_PHYPA|nr:hypothetical protein PHYPA_013287 [Physcomitrium patens]
MQLLPRSCRVHGNIEHPELCVGCQPMRSAEEVFVRGKVNLGRAQDLGHHLFYSSFLTRVEVFSRGGVGIQQLPGTR